MAKGSGTRSGLLWEVERLLKECEELPQILLMENVPMIHSKANLNDFQSWLDFLSDLGYSSYFDDLNSCDYGVAQNRNRTFCVSILGNYSYRFPDPIELNKDITDYLDEDVEEKYFNRSERAYDILKKLKNLEFTRGGKRINVVGNLWEDNGHNSQSGRVYSPDGICPALGASHFQQVKYIVVEEDDE